LRYLAKGDPRAEIIVPTRTVQIDLPVMLKDIALPVQR